MNLILRNTFAVIAGILFGSAVNMGIIMISDSIIPPPEGADDFTMEGLKASMHIFQPQHFIMPFLAHALGTFAGALICGLFAAIHKMKLVLFIGLIFLIGGISNVFMLTSPAWFAILDIAGAYIPMAYLAGRIVVKKRI